MVESTHQIVINNLQSGLFKVDLQNILFMKKWLLIACLAFIGSVQAQEYTNAIGVRLGSPFGISFKTFLNNSDNALEFIAASNSKLNESLILYGLYEKHADVFGEPHFKLYYGGGAHVGYYRKGSYRNSLGSNSAEFFREDATVLGVDGIVGVEYSIGDIPLAFSIDIKPTLELNTFDPLSLDGAIALKFVF